MISPDIEEKEIVLFLLLIYARMYRNCYSFFKTYKDDLNNGFKDIGKGAKFEEVGYETVTESLIKLYNIGKSNEKKTTFSLLKWPAHYSINVGSMKTINPNLYFYCASLLLLPKIKNKEKFLHCLIDIANACSNKRISMSEGVSIPKKIVDSNYPHKN